MGASSFVESKDSGKVCFSTIEDNMIRLSVHFPYFEKVGDADVIIEEELKKRPELCEKIEDEKDDEVKQILADPLLVAMIKPQAEKAGMTVADYVRLFQKMLEDYPEQFMEWLTQKMKDKHNELSHEE